VNATTRPLAVTILAWVYIAVGSIGFVYHSPAIQAKHAFQFDDVWIELVEATAVLAGAFLLRGDNWARWLAIAWMAFHVVVSAFHPLRELAVHAALCALFAWILFRPEARRFFAN
jgi:hypothetical protein